MPFMAVLVALAATAAAPPPALSAQAQALIAPVHAAFAKVEADQAKLPSPRNDRERLERMYDPDQVGRVAISDIDFSVLPEGERERARTTAWDEINAHDLADQRVLKAILKRDGWITIPRYGKKASSVAFLIVQHAVNDPALMRHTLKLLGPLAAKGQVNGGDYALLFDRMALEFDNKPQRYGSQVRCDHGAWKPISLEDPEHVDERRRAVGMKWTEAEYLKLFQDQPCH
jgi:hypothetical protein